MKYIFVLGASRSGTTMLANVLGASRSCYKTDELHYFSKLKSNEFSAPLIPDRMDYLGTYLIDALLNDVWDRGRDIRKAAKIYRTIFFDVNEVVNGVQLFDAVVKYFGELYGFDCLIEQTPANYNYMDKLLGSDISLGFVFMKWDVRGVIMSQKNRWKRRFRGDKKIPLADALLAYVNYNPVVIARLWRSARGSSKFSSGNAAVHTINFEVFLSAPRPFLKELCNALGIEYSEDFLNIKLDGSSTVSNSNGADKIGIMADFGNAWSTVLNSGELLWAKWVYRNRLSIINNQEGNIDYIIKYEDLIVDTDSVLKEMCIKPGLEYLGEKYFESKINLLAPECEIDWKKDAIAGGVRRSPLNKIESQDVARIVSPEAGYFGYELSDQEYRLLRRAWFGIIFVKRLMRFAFYKSGANRLVGSPNRGEEYPV